MNWLWILIMAAVGVLASLLSIYGMFPTNTWISIGLILIAALALGYTSKQKWFLNGLITGAVWYFISGFLQYRLWDTLMANNPDLQQKLADAQAKVTQAGLDSNVMEPKIWSMFVGAIFGGLVLGLLTWVAGKLLAEKPKPQPVPPVQVEEHDTTGQ